jgi:hypothetical protein
VLSNQCGDGGTYIQGLIDDFNADNTGPCGDVRYCPANLQTITRIGRPTGQGQMIDNGNGCFSINCDGPGNDKDFCIKDIYPFPLQGGVSITTCAVRVYNVGQLLLWKDQISLKHPNFTNSELSQFLETNKNHPSTICAHVAFCLDDFRVITSNINTIPCLPTECALLSTNDPEVMLAQCLVLCPTGVVYGTTYCPKFYVLYEKFDGLFFNGGGEDDVKRVITTYNDLWYGSDEFDQFGYLQKGGDSYPKGLFKTGTANDRHYDYYVLDNNQKRKTIPNLRFYVESWDDSTLVYIEKTAQGFAIESEDQWRKLVESSQWVEATDFKKNRSGYWITGRFSGSLTYQDVVIGTSTDTSVFVLQIGPDGVLHTPYILHNVRNSSGLDFHSTAYGTIISGASRSNYVGMGSGIGNIGNLYAGGLFSIRLDSNYLYSAVPHGLSLGNNMQLVKSAVSPDGSQTTYLIKGSGTIVHSGTSLVSSLTAGYWLVTTSSTGQLKWTLPLGKINLSEKELDMTYSDSLGLYLGLTFRDTLSLGLQQWISKGGKDVFIAKINPNGTLYSAQSYGSSDDEVIKKLFHNSGFLYLGGDYHGATAERSIGNNKFVNLGMPRANLSRAYMTYLTDLDLLQPSDSLGQGIATRQKADTGNSFLKAFPNPFKDELMVNIGGHPGKCQVKLLDMLGKTIYVENCEIPASGSQTFKLSQFGQLPTGVYFVQANASDGKVQTVKVVKE